MLILTRKIDGATVIRTSDGDIVVRVLGVERNRVQLGFEAPAACLILREELDVQPRERKRA